VYQGNGTGLLDFIHKAIQAQPDPKETWVTSGVLPNVEKVLSLKREGNLESAEHLLLQEVASTEYEDNINQWGVAPWCYEQLAIIYRKQKDYKSEVRILERFACQRHAPGALPPKLLARLKKAKVLLEKSRS
jgi:hypothetical protein